MPTWSEADEDPLGDGGTEPASSSSLGRSVMLANSLMTAMGVSPVTMATRCSTR